MNTDRLRVDLADLADEVIPVDLRDRALRTSRRLGVQRAVATSAATVVMVGAATGTAFAILPRANGPAVMPADTPSITFTPSPADAIPAPTVSPETSAAQRGGTRYYLGREFEPNAEGALTVEYAVIYAVRGDTTEVVASVRAGDDPCVRNSITVSPDGRLVAWVGDGDSSGVGTARTARTDGLEIGKSVISGVTCLGSTPLVWSGGDRMIVQNPLSTSFLMDLKTRQPVGVDPGRDRDRCWSADGRYLAAVDVSGTPFVAGPGGRRAYRYSPPPDEATRWNGWSARSVSMDGRYVSVGWKGPSRQDGSFAVVDTTTSKLVDLPVQGEIRSIHFTADRKVLVRQADRIVVLDPQFDVLDEVAEPINIRELTLLAYVP
jgi:hypothetical protein